MATYVVLSAVSDSVCVRLWPYQYGIEIVCSQESIPMGTAGPLYLARDHLLADSEPFFMFNSDVICDFPLASMLAFHRSHGCQGTILVTKVSDPSKYGVVVSGADGQIEKFVEKPQQFVGDKINAGIYLFSTSILNRIENKPTSIEREIFPQMAADHQLFSFVLQGYWMDIGQPKDFLSGQVLHLAHLQAQAQSQQTDSQNLNQNLNQKQKQNHGAGHDPISSVELASGEGIIGNCLIHPTAKIGKGALIGPDVVIGPGVVIGESARVIRSCLFDGALIGASSLVKGSLIGWASSIGRHSHVHDCVLGEDVTVAPEIILNQITVCPHKAINQNEIQAKILL